MNNGRYFILSVMLLLFSFLGLAGCGRMIAAIHKVPYDDQIRMEAQELFNSLLEKNQCPETFKGIGNFSITNDHGVEKGRIAWMASGPDKFRIELLTPYGQPGAGFSTDGQYFYAVFYADKKFIKRTLSESSLKPFISISLRPEEIISFFCGRPPAIDYSFISMITPPDTSEPILVLQKRWWKGYQKIYPDISREHIRSFETYDGSGKLQYKADFSTFTQVNGNRIPYRMEISDGMGIILELVVNRYWPEVEIASGSFVLSPPER